MKAGTAEQGVVEKGTKGSAWGEFCSDGTTDNGKEVGHWEAIFREESIRGTPILKLRTGGGGLAG